MTLDSVCTCERQRKRPFHISLSCIVISGPGLDNEPGMGHISFNDETLNRLAVVDDISELLKDELDFIVANEKESGGCSLEKGISGPKYLWSKFIKDVSFSNFSCRGVSSGGKEVDKELAFCC